MCGSNMYDNKVVKTPQNKPNFEANVINVFNSLLCLTLLQI